MLRAAAEVGEERPLGRGERRVGGGVEVEGHRVLRRGRRRRRPVVGEILHDGCGGLAADGGAGALRAGLRPGRNGARVRRDLKSSTKLVPFVYTFADAMVNAPPCNAPCWALC